jgi:hypothetical protein
VTGTPGALGPNQRGARRAVALVFGTVLLAACGSNAASEPSGSASPPATDAPTEPTVETQSPTPTVAPATGKAIKVEGLMVRTPQGWNTNIPLALQQAAFPKGVIGTIMRVYHFPNSGLFTIDELADAEVAEYGANGRRLEDLELDGEQVYHLVGNPDRGVYAERFGTIIDDARVFLEFQFANDEDRSTRDEIIQSVLATVQLG